MANKIYTIDQWGQDNKVKTVWDGANNTVRNFNWHFWKVVRIFKQLL